MRSLILILLFFVFASCSYFFSQNEPKLIQSILANVSDNSEPYNVKASFSAMQDNVNRINYKGVVDDKITISNKRYELDYCYPKFQTDSLTTTPRIKMFVDTSTVTSIYLNDDQDIPIIPTMQSLESFQKENEKADESIQKKELISSYLVFMYNSGANQLLIDLLGDELFIIQEAKNEFGVWQPIEYSYPSWCGTAYGQIILQPGELIISKAFKYEGDFRTHLRLKFNYFGHKFYSNSFKGSINKEQFEVPDFSGRRVGNSLTDEQFNELIFLDFK